MNIPIQVLLLTTVFSPYLSAAERIACDQDGFMSELKPLTFEGPDGKQIEMGTACGAAPRDIPYILAAFENRPLKKDWGYYGRASEILQGLLKEPKNRTPDLKLKLITLSKSDERPIYDAAFDCLMEFKKDPEVRKVLVEALHHHKDSSTRGVMTGRLVVNSENDPTIAPELKEALNDPEEFVRVRAAMDLSRLGDFSGIAVMKQALNATPNDRKEDFRIGQNARAAGEMLSSELVEPLNRLVALGKAAPHSSGEARQALWKIEIKNAKDREARNKYVRTLMQTPEGVRWISESASYKAYADQLGIQLEDLIPMFEETATSTDWNTSYTSSETVKRLRQAVQPKK